MGGVDRSDQMMNSYPVECKRLKKWYKKMWIHKKKGGKLMSLEFCTKLVSQISSRPSTADNPFRLVEQHFLSYIPPTEKKVNVTKWCVVCRKPSVQKES